MTLVGGSPVVLQLITMKGEGTFCTDKICRRPMHACACTCVCEHTYMWEESMQREKLGAIPV